LQASLNGSSFMPTNPGDAAATQTQQRLFASSQNSLLKQLGTKEQELKKIDEQIKVVLVDKKEADQLLQVGQEKETRLREVKDIIAREEYDKANNEVVSLRAKVDEDEHKLAELKHAQGQVSEEIEHIKEDYRTSNLQDLANKQKQMTDLEARLKESSYKNAKQVIVSPVDGYVNTLFVHTLGGVVTPAEKLVSIVPANTPPMVQAFVSSRDIGFVQQDMPVSIKVDTFDFQKYGMFEGKVKLISRDSHQDEKLGTVYDVYIQPVTPYLMIDGKRRMLTPGMSVVSEIKVGKRHIIEFFVYPLIKHLHEGMSVR